jgi:glycosyltransferase involved in cell wall biosynthesis
MDMAEPAKALVSVIVPVYNVEAYMDRCVSSLCGQSYDKIEIVLVDDGSTDGSGTLCDAWAAKDSRIRVIHKENGGLSDARNVGIAASSGEYIAFIDGDDYVADTYCEKLYEALLRNDADMALCNLCYVWEDGTLRPYMTPCHEKKVVTRKEGLHALLCESNLTFGIVCNKVYKRDLFMKEPPLQFALGRYYEDEYINYRLLDKAKKIVWIPDVLYSYVQRDDSITHRYSEKHVMDHWALIDESLRWNPREAYKKELMAKKCLALLFDLYRRIQIHQLHSLCTQDMRERMRLVLRRIPQRELSIKDTVKVLLILHGGYGPIFKMKQRIAAFWWWLSASLWRR